MPILKRFLVTMVAILCMILALIQQCAVASAIPTSQPIQRTIAQSSFIAVSQIIDFTPDTNSKHNMNAIMAINNHSFSTAAYVLYSLYKINDLGAYKFNISQQLVGEAVPSIQITLPPISGMYYGGAKLNLISKSIVLIFFKKDVYGNYVPTDPTVPLIPITQEAVDRLQKTDTVQSKVLNLMLFSAADPLLRQTETYLLRNVVDPQIVVGLASYLDDPNLETRSNVLYCMAENQQVSVIPRIAALERETEKRNDGASTNAVGTLGDFTTPDAVPYLNPLLFESAYYTRLNTMFSLGRLAGQSSVPYLMLALRDPDPQKVIPSGAWGLLHRVVPKLKRPVDTSDNFYDHRVAETKVLYDWWNDELSGKHLAKTSGGPAVLKRTLPIGAPITVLNTSLFEPSSLVRAEAISRLRKLADKSSIPYLVLALQDPDTKVAYLAYEILHRLIPALGAGQSETAFTAGHDAATQPIYEWWNDELLGKHLPKSPA